MTEIELKFALDARGERRLLRRVRELLPADRDVRTARLRSVYFDTEDFRLKDAGLSLRLRRDGRRWIQTVKAGASLVAGLSRVREYEHPARGASIDLSLIGDAAVEQNIRETIAGGVLRPVFETIVRRRHCEVSQSGTTAEIAIDAGEVLAGDIRAKFIEAEIELRNGDASGLFEIARQLFPDGGASPSRLAKSARGYLLLETGTLQPPLVPRLAVDPAIRKGQAVDESASAVLVECLAQIVDNVEFVRNIDAVEGPHQLRIGLRRLRSALALFGTAIGGTKADRLRDEARWLSAEVGRVRDFDVLLNDIILPAANAHPAEKGLLPLAVALSPRKSVLLDGLRTMLGGSRVQGFVFDLACFAQTHGWRPPESEHAIESRPVEEIAEEALARVWRRVRKRARNLDGLDIDARHELRKELKKLRYAVEFLGSIFPAGKVRPFLKRLKNLQEVFGSLNDSAMAARMLSSEQLRALGISGSERAAGWISGSCQSKADLAWEHARRSWNDLKKARPFWV